MGMAVSLRVPIIKYSKPENELVSLLKGPISVFV